MFRCVLILTVLISSLGEWVLSQEIKIDDRFAKFQLQLADASDKVSVLIEKVSLDDSLNVASIFDSNGRKVSSDVERRLSSLRTFQRVVFGSKGKRKRVDATQFSLLEGGGLFNSNREAQLIHEHEGWYYNKALNQKGISRFQVRAGVFDMVTETRWKHPFSTATTNGGGMLVDKESEWLLYPSQTFAELYMIS